MSFNVRISGIFLWYNFNWNIPYDIILAGIFPYLEIYNWNISMAVIFVWNICENLKITTGKYLQVTNKVLIFFFSYLCLIQNDWPISIFFYWILSFSLICFDIYLFACLHSFIFSLFRSFQQPCVPVIIHLFCFSYLRLILHIMQFPSLFFVCLFKFTNFFCPFIVWFGIFSSRLWYPPLLGNSLY